MPIRVIITQGTSADCKHAIELIDNFEADMLIADRGYDTNKIINFALKNNMQVTIPPKINRIQQRQYDKYIYKARHLVENAFLKLKGWRSIATRYAKTRFAFLGGVSISCSMIWLKTIS